MPRTPEPVPLSFAAAGHPDEFTLDLSAAVQVGDDHWLGTDEGTRLASPSPRRRHGATGVLADRFRI